MRDDYACPSRKKALDQFGIGEGAWPLEVSDYLSEFSMGD